MKTIAKFTKAEEAYLLCSRLESAGIAAFVAHEHASIMVPMTNTVRVEVADEDEEAARALMAEE